METSLCEKCQSCKDGKCTDCFEPGVLYACVNFLEVKSDEDRPDNV